MLNTFLLAMILASFGVAEKRPTENAGNVFPTRLAGTWTSESRESDRLGARSGVIANSDLVTFKDAPSWDKMTDVFVDPKHVDAPLHVGGVTLRNNAEALFVLRGRIGYLEIGTTPGGGGVETVKWETLHLIRGTDLEHDMLVIGHTIYKRKP